MGSASSSHSNWNNLPNEIKIKIIRELDNNSRLSLRVCSLDDYQLVHSVPFQTIHKICLRDDYLGNWHIVITKNLYGSKTSFVFESFQDFQNKLVEEIEKTDCFNFFTTDIMGDSGQQLKLTKSGKLVKVREVNFANYDKDAPNVLAQIDPIHLRKLELNRNGMHLGIFETPQAKQVRNISGRGDHITDDQLLKMENQELFLERTEHITIAGINKYIKKCLLTLNSQPVGFKIEFRSSKENLDDLFEGIEAEEIVLDRPNYKERYKCILNSSSKIYQLEVKFCSSYIKATTIGKNGQVENLQNYEPRNSFKSVDCIKISPNRFVITGRSTAPVHYIFDSIDEMQKKLIEKITKLDYIKRLRILYTSHVWILCPPNKQVTIGKLSVYDGEINADFLKQIEPVQLKRIKIHSYKTDEKIYDTPQLIKAQNIGIANCSVRDPVIINLNSVKIFYNSSQLKSLTDSGINTFIKNILTDFHGIKYVSEVCYLQVHRNADDHFQGLTILSKERVYDTVKNMVNSSFPGFKLEQSEINGPFFGYSDKTIRGIPIKQSLWLINDNL